MPRDYVNASLSRDRVARIEHQIHQRLLRLTAADPRRRPARVELEDQRDVDREQPGKNCRHFHDNVVEVEHGITGCWLAPGKG